MNDIFRPKYRGKALVIDDEFKVQNELVNHNMEVYNINIIHIPPIANWRDDWRDNSVIDGRTIAWRRLNSKFIEVSVAYCSPKDQYSKKLGKILAVQNMLVKQEHIKVQAPIRQRKGPSEYTILVHMFTR